MAGLHPDTIRVRMYRVGFGDCFLISVPQDSGHAHILVDCGVHAKGDPGTLPAVIADILEETHQELALIIATHAHQDHISGFTRFEAQFRSCRVGEIWLPWIENPADPSAARLKTRRLALVNRLHHHFTAARISPAMASVLLNLRGNEAALRLLKSGMRGRVRFLEATDKLPDAAGVPGLHARILGPPRDPEFLAQLDPSQGARFLRAHGTPAEPRHPLQPFAEKWLFKPAGLPFPPLTEKERQLLEEMASDPEALAFALDRAVNNTSLALLLSYRGRQLLLTGDAQYGNWEHWLREPGAAALLAQVDFYKVGHHGSSNGTPRRALQQMPRHGFAAMVSTQTVPWPGIPMPPLMDALRTRSAGVVRSDSLPAKGSLPAGFSRGKLWFDYELPC